MAYRGQVGLSFPSLSGSPCTKSLPWSVQCHWSTGIHANQLPRRFLAWGLSQRGGGGTKMPFRTGAWLSGQESQGTHSGTGTFQNVSSVGFFEGEGLRRWEKKSAEG